MYEVAQFIKPSYRWALTGVCFDFYQGMPISSLINSTMFDKGGRRHVDDLAWSMVNNKVWAERRYRERLVT